MKLYVIRILFIISIIATRGFSQEFNYSEVMAVPNLSFFPGVLTGLDVLEELGFEPIVEMNLAILTNQTAVNRHGVHLLDLLAEKKDELDVKVVYVPEFGLFAGERYDVRFVTGDTDPRFGAQIKSLWGRKFRPDRHDLDDVDLVLIDIQDPGVRFFSFMTTVTKVMEVAATAGVPVMVLDRPNPLNGTVMSGPTVRPQYQSFVGYHLVPIRHGLTIGEYALMINETGWIRQAKRVQLTIVPLANWKRTMWYDETGLPWVSPAPKVRDLNTLLAFSGLGLLEGTNISDGAGTDLPILQAGAPWISGAAIAKSLNEKNLPGVRFSSVTFMPDSLSPLIDNPYYRGETCSGVKITITDRDSFLPIRTATTILSVISRYYPDKLQWTGRNYIDRLYGHNYLRIFLAQERDPRKLPATWTHDIIKFSQFRGKFLLY